MMLLYLLLGVVFTFLIGAVVFAVSLSMGASEEGADLAAGLATLICVFGGITWVVFSVPLSELGKFMIRAAAAVFLIVCFLVASSCVVGLFVGWDGY